MSATNTFETNLLALITKNTACPNVGDSTGLAGSAVAGSLFVSLTTASSGETGDQDTSEISYTSYARVTVSRTPGDGSGWTVSGNTADNAAAITFATATGGTTTAVAFGVGSDVSGAGNLHLYGSLTSSLVVSNGITPQFAVGALDITLD